MRRAAVALSLFLAATTALAEVRQTSAPDPEFALLRAAASGPVAGADPALARAALEETIADAVVSKLNGTAPLVAGEGRAIASLSALVPDLAPVAAKAATLAKGKNPFDAAGAPFERALAARCAVDQVAGAEDPAASVEQRRRAEAALDAARASGSLVLTCDALAWLGLYAIQGGDVAVARRFLSEAADAADRTGSGPARLTTRHYLGLAYALDGDLKSALRETSIAEREIAERRVPDDVRASAGPAIYSELIDYATRLEDRAAAVRLATASAELLDSIGAPAPARAEALERLGQLHAQGARGDARSAKLGAAALASAARLWTGEKQGDRAVFDYTSAGVLLVENAGGEGARAALEPALPLAGKSARLRAGVEFWLGRADLLEAASAPTPEGGRAAFARGVGLLRSALARLETSKDADVGLRITIDVWLGRAYLDGPGRDAREATLHLRRAFDRSVAAKDANTAIACAELALRADPANAATAAADFYDRLVTGTNLDPLAAVAALSAELQRDASSPSGVAPSGVAPSGVAPEVVAFSDRVSASLAKTDERRAAAVDAALVTTAATARDRALLAARGDKAFERLTTAADAAGAESLASAAWGAWTALGDAATAATWRGRYETLAKSSYDAARAAHRSEAAARSAEGLLRAARERGDAEAVRTWLAAAVDVRRETAESLERSGKLGLALDAWRALGDVSSAGGDAEGARSAFARAAEIASRVGDRGGRAAALAGRARAELDLGDAPGALATAREALALASSVAIDGPDALPPAAGVAFRPAAIDALGVRSAALAALARAADGAERDRLAALARAADELAAALRTTP